MARSTSPSTFNVAPENLDPARRHGGRLPAHRHLVRSERQRAGDAHRQRPDRQIGLQRGRRTDRDLHLRRSHRNHKLDLRRRPRPCKARTTSSSRLRTWYDGDGNTIATADYQRLPSAHFRGGAHGNELLRHRLGQLLRRCRPRHRERQLRPRRLIAGRRPTAFFFNGRRAPDRRRKRHPAVAEPTTADPRLDLRRYIVSQTVYIDTSAAGPDRRNDQQRRHHHRDPVRLDGPHDPHDPEL